MVSVIKQCEIAVRAESREPATHLWLATMLQRRGRTEEAEKHKRVAEYLRKIWSRRTL